MIKSGKEIISDNLVCCYNSNECCHSKHNAHRLVVALVSFDGDSVFAPKAGASLLFLLV